MLGLRKINGSADAPAIERPDLLLRLGVASLCKG